MPNHVARQYFSDAKPARVKDLGEGDDMSLGFSANNNFYYIQGQTLHTDFTDVRAADGPYREYPAKATEMTALMPGLRGMTGMKP